MANIHNPNPDSFPDATLPGQAVSKGQLDAKGIVSVKDALFGAVGDGTTDDLAALTAASASAMDNGHDLHIPRGVYRVTGSWLIGVGIVQTVADTIANTANYTWANAGSTKYRPRIIADRGAVIWGDFSPVSVTAIIDYQLPSTGSVIGGSGGGVEGLTILGQDGWQSGALYDPATPWSLAKTSVKQVGLHFVQGCKVTRGLLLRELMYGMMGAGCYWTDHASLEFYRCGTCLQLPEFNAGTARQLLMSSSDIGLVIHGDAFVIDGIHTEEVAQDIIWRSGAASAIRGAYIEDTTTTDGSGAYAVKLGTTANGNDVSAARLEGIRVGSVGTGGTAKKALRLYGTRNTTLADCRLFGHGFDQDTVSYGQVIGSDFDPGDNFNFVGDGAIRPPLGYNDAPAAAQFGLRGDGVTDNTALLVAALAKTNRIRFGPGTYLFSSSALLTVNAVLEGSGINKTIFKVSGTNNMLELPNHGYGIKLRGITFRGMSSAGHLIYSTGFVEESDIEDCEFIQNNSAKSLVYMTGGAFRVGLRGNVYTHAASATSPSLYFEDAGGTVKALTIEKSFGTNLLIRVLNKAAGSPVMRVSIRDMVVDTPDMGLIDLAGAEYCVVENVEYYGLSSGAVAPIRVRRGDNGGSAGTGLQSANCTLRGIGRSGGTLAGGVYDIDLTGSRGDGGHLLQMIGYPLSGGTRMLVNANFGSNIITGETGRLTLDGSDYCEVIDPAIPRHLESTIPPNIGPQGKGQSWLDKTNKRLWYGFDVSATTDFKLIAAGDESVAFTGGSISPDGNTCLTTFVCSITSNATINAPVNLKIGHIYVFEYTQGPTGAFTITYNAAWLAGSATATVTATGNSTGKIASDMFRAVTATTARRIGPVPAWA